MAKAKALFADTSFVIKSPADASEERWLSVVGYEGIYEVSDLGGVRSVDRVVAHTNRWGSTTLRPLKGRVLKLTVDAQSSAYTRLQAKLCNGGRDTQKTRLVHHLVLEAFVGPRPTGMEAAHGDGNAANNRADNLRWATPKENNADKKLHGTHLQGEIHHLTKLSDDDCRRIRELRKSKRTFQSIADEFGISIAQAHRINSGARRGYIQ